MIGRKGVTGRDEIPRKSRHIALKFSQVLDHSERLFWVPTKAQRADGLTKSINREALKMILNNPKPEVVPEDWQEDEEVFFAF